MSAHPFIYRAGPLTSGVIGQVVYAYDIVLNGYELGGGDLHVTKNFRTGCSKALGFSAEK